jgi:membrane protein YdbS with pleckstrin-like domain
VKARKGYLATVGMLRRIIVSLVRNGRQLSTPRPQVQTLPKRQIKPASVVYWMRVFLAVVAGFANQVLQINEVNFGDIAIFVGIGLGLVIYLFSIFIVQRVLRYGEAELKGKNRYITLGGGTFIILWIVVSVFLYTVLP